MQRDAADNAKTSQQKGFFRMMCRIGDEMDAASRGALSLPPSNARVLDLCMAPGGYAASALKHSPHASVRGITLPSKLGGHRVIYRHPRLKVTYGDITMLHEEFGVTEVPNDHCDKSNFSNERLWYSQSFDLVFCDGQALRTHGPHIADYRRQVEADRLRVSQLILAMQRIASGGTFIMLLHKAAAYDTIKLLNVFDHIANVQLFKPSTSHSKRGSFYLIARNVQPRHPEAKAAVNEWKATWKRLTFPTLDQDEQHDPPTVPTESELAEEVSGLLEKFGQRVIELGEPIWQIQKAALAKAKWSKGPNKETHSGQINAGEASTTATDNAALAVHESKDGPGHGEDPANMDPAPASGELLKPVAGDPMGSADVHRAIERLDIGN